MREEFHGAGWNDGTGPFKLLYGWGSINANVWLPSLSELVGYNPDTYNESYGTYLSAMQGLNVVTWYFVDTQGGNQFSYFQQFNGNGGGEKLWVCGGSEQFLLRSVRWDNTQSNWIMRDVTYFHTPDVTTSLAVHPVVDASSISLASAYSESSLTPLHLLSTKRHVCCGYAFVINNAGITPPLHYHLFVGKGVLETALFFILLKKLTKGAVRCAQLLLG